MIYAFLSHQVKDYNTWRPYYDADESRRNNYGIKTLKVFREVGHPHSVGAYWEVEDPAKVVEMGKEPQLQEVIKKAGVSSEPVIHFYEEV